MKKIIPSALALLLALAFPAHAGNLSADIFKATESVQIDEQSSAPTAPASGKQKLYPKTNGAWYGQDDTGTEYRFQFYAPIPDSQSIVEDNSDGTKELAFELSGITTATTRTWTVPDQDIDFGTNQTKLDSIESSADVTDATNVDAAGAVMESDYDANTILAADSDNTPAALTVAEQTLIGRITSGNIDALTASEVKTLLSLDQALNLKSNLSATGAPSITDDDTAGYAVGSIWIDTNNGNVYFAEDVTTGAANWLDVSAGAAGGDPDQNLFQDFAADNGTASSADGTTDTLTLTGGVGIFTDSDSTTDTITLSVCDDDEDTCIDNERTSDDDIIYFKTGGTDRAQIDSNGLTLQNGVSVNEFSTDESMAGDSDDAVPTEQTVKAYVDQRAAPNRNYIICGGMQDPACWPEGTSDTGASDGDYMSAMMRLDDTGAGVLDWAQETSVPTDPDYYFEHSLSVTATTGLGSPGTSDQIVLQTFVPGHAYESLHNEDTITLSFYMKLDETGGDAFPQTGCVAFKNSGSGNTYLKEYSITADDTWQKVTITLTPDTVGTWLFDEGIGMRVMWPLAAGTDLDDGSDGAWVATDELWTSGCTNLADDNGDKFYITGIKLEKGGQATKWTPYFWSESVPSLEWLIERKNFDSVSGEEIRIMYSAGTSSAVFSPVYHKKRVVPSFSAASASAFTYQEAGSNKSCSSLAGAAIGKQTMRIDFTCSSLTAGNVGRLFRNGTSTAWMQWDARY